MSSPLCMIGLFQILSKQLLFQLIHDICLHYIDMIFDQNIELFHLILLLVAEKFESMIFFLFLEMIRCKISLNSMLYMSLEFRLTVNIEGSSSYSWSIGHQLCIEEHPYRNMFFFRECPWKSQYRNISLFNTCFI